MSMTESQPESVLNESSYPGQHLAAAREAKGYSQEYVAGKLHLRVRVIELLESDRYDELPQPVFVQGYFRAYAKLLDLAVEPLLALYTQIKAPEHQAEQVLRQRRREPQYWDVMLRWISGLAIFLLGIGAVMWWSHHSELSFSSTEARQSLTTGLETPLKAAAFSTLTDISSSLETTSLNAESPALESHDG